jgi:hypothetical protein
MHRWMLERLRWMTHDGAGFDLTHAVVAMEMVRYGCAFEMKF